MPKKEMISLWVLSEQKEICKKLKITYPEIWNAGFNFKIPKTKEELKNLRKKYYVCIYNITICIYNLMMKKSKIT